jgi:hypothetical protein
MIMIKIATNALAMVKILILKKEIKKTIKARSSISTAK